jgi:hypothetical protein
MAAHRERPRRLADMRILEANMREFLQWVARSPRTYATMMEAWGSHCPRFTVWEDALDAGFVQVEGRQGEAIDEAAVTLTPRGLVEWHRAFEHHVNQERSALVADRLL